MRHITRIKCSLARCSTHTHKTKFFLIFFFKFCYTRFLWPSISLSPTTLPHRPPFHFFVGVWCACINVSNTNWPRLVGNMFLVVCCYCVHIIAYFSLNVCVCVHALSNLFILVKVQINTVGQNCWCCYCCWNWYVILACVRCCRWWWWCCCWPMPVFDD